MDKMLTAEEVSKLTGLGVQAVQRYARKNEIPSITIGAKRRFPESALRQWLEGKLASNAPTQPQPAGTSASAA